LPQGHQPLQLATENVLVEKQDRTEGLVLRRGANLSLGSEIGKELSDFTFSQLVRMSLSVKEDETNDPPDVSLFGSRTIVAGSNRLSYPIEQTRLYRGLGIDSSTHSVTAPVAGSSCQRQKDEKGVADPP
jgi:hypothetical protein